jgi:hypothetical protein
MIQNHRRDNGVKHRNIVFDDVPLTTLQGALQTGARESHRHLETNELKKQGIPPHDRLLCEAGARGPARNTPYDASAAKVLLNAPPLLASWQNRDKEIRP